VAKKRAKARASSNLWTQWRILAKQFEWECVPLHVPPTELPDGRRVFDLASIKLPASPDARLKDLDYEKVGRRWWTGTALMEATEEVAERADAGGLDPTCAWKLRRKLYARRQAATEEHCAMIAEVGLLVNRLQARKKDRGKRGERDAEAVNQRKAQRRAWILEAVRKHKKPARTVAELLRWLRRDATHDTSDKTLRADLRAMLRSGEATAAELPPAGRDAE